ncbi:Outer membrane protein beta-barrel domain-containing protein [Mucilaginibacter pineti]|uniref:Outer membrane protein beta-barrel domain-containing protein n=1 Tax=Mucilaginibacter pineti TaxID=1391627 RepID=A0A1G7MC18_9SPHI|nr:outer membrane beta-barrel protein [Mucilaginibacter pineti]SDF59327.1 Outer membrane protein beta-barrel domain-containing protein [Mucilaginibacter pineti]
MKRLIFTILVCVAASNVFAQTTPTDSTKTVITKDSVNIKKGVHIKLGFGGDVASVNVNDTAYHASKAPGFSFGVTFSRIDLGFATLIDNGSFTLSPKNDFLSYRQWKTSNFGFDLVQFGYRFNSSFKIYVSGGFDWTNIRLRKDITIQRNAPVLTYTEDDIHYSKNKFASCYLRIPLSFYYRSHEDDNGNCFRLVAGPEIGILLNGRVKQISEENGKQKFDDDYHFTRLRAGGFVRMGYGIMGIYAKYYATDMFENSPEQKGLRNFSFGLTFGF